MAQCLYIRQSGESKGERCKRTANEGMEYCEQHNPNSGRCKAMATTAAGKQRCQRLAVQGDYCMRHADPKKRDTGVPARKSAPEERPLLIRQVKIMFKMVSTQEEIDRTVVRLRETMGWRQDFKVEVE